MSIVKNVHGIEIQTGCASCAHYRGMTGKQVKDILKNVSLPQVECACSGENQVATKVFPYGKCDFWKMSDTMKHFQPRENKDTPVKPKEYFEWITSLTASQLQSFVHPFYEWMTTTIDGKIYAQQHPEQLSEYYDPLFPTNRIAVHARVSKKRKNEGKEEEPCL